VKPSGSNMARFSQNFSDKRWLKMKKKPKLSNKGGRIIRTVDLFAGIGGIALGVSEACRRNRYGHTCELANEWDQAILTVLSDNLNPKVATGGDVGLLFNRGLFSKNINELNRKKLTVRETNLLEKYPEIYEPDLLTGGPPCQGHSDLNNHSRREDPRNALYYRMVRAAKVLNPKAIIIENVSTVVHSKEKVVQNSEKLLTKMGYKVKLVMVWGNEFGVPQKRKRHFLVASRISEPDVSLLDDYRMEKNRTLRWAIEDLESLTYSTTYDSPADSDDENKTRMQWLIDKDEYDLPNKLRPDCHKDGHNYPAVYGRMYYDEPSPTLTTGFRSNGQGRFTHPTANPARPLTPHEGARIQTFPDWFSFDSVGVTKMSKGIGNAVPPILAMYVAHVALMSIESNSND
jgi:DNA (cytosine-5)-methyltransferase 1